MTEKEALELLMQVNQLGATIMSLTKRLQETQTEVAVTELEDVGKQWQDLKDVVLKLVDETRVRISTTP